jgi:glucose-6-phosphate 1-dehydrogenase
MTELQGGLCVEELPQAAGIVIFGASGDLTARKIIPALCGLYRRGFMPNFFVLGCGRKPLADADFRRRAHECSVDECGGAVGEDFTSRFYYENGDYADPDFYKKIHSRCAELAAKHNTQGHVIFYLATPPAAFRPITTQLASSPLSKQEGRAFSRLIIEKPFGTDRADAMEINKILAASFGEERVYRIDHYLGKETVQNMLMLRFANPVFNAIWNAGYIDNVQITAAETLGVEKRGEYYERNGALLDMFANHMLRLLALVAMEPPLRFDATDFRDGVEEVYKAIAPLSGDNICDCLVRGQYAAGEAEGKPAVAYRQEPKVAAGSQTETYLAARLTVNTPRWKNVPFYLRTGKRLSHKYSGIIITFKKSVCTEFPPLKPEHIEPDILCQDLEPEERTALLVQTKQPGPRFCMQTRELAFKYGGWDTATPPPQAYERMLADCLLGDQTLFVRADNLQTSWDFITPVMETWRKNPDASPLRFYKAGEWGPKEADAMLARDNRKWHVPFDLHM